KVHLPIDSSASSPASSRVTLGSSPGLSNESQTAEQRDHDRDFLGHPRGLAYLAISEGWERFSFYGMQTLLVLYMVKQLLLPGHVENIALFPLFRRLYHGLTGQPLASAIFGTYAASVYLTPILGGFLADRLLGTRRTVLLGAITMAPGHFL